MRLSKPKTAPLFGGIALGVMVFALLIPHACAAQLAEDPQAEQLEEGPPPSPGEDIRPIPGRSFGPPGRPGFERQGPPRGRRGGPGAMLWERMTQEERAELKAFIAENFPERYDELLELEEVNPAMLHRQIARMLPEIMKMRELSERDPDLFDLRIAEHRNEFELRRLARRYRHAVGQEEREELRIMIRPLIEQQFDLRQHRMEFEVIRLEQKIQRLHQNMERRAMNREAEINRAFERILHSAPPHEADEQRMRERRERRQRREHLRGSRGLREPRPPERELDE